MSSSESDDTSDPLPPAPRAAAPDILGAGSQAPAASATAASRSARHDSRAPWLCSSVRTRCSSFSRPASPCCRDVSSIYSAQTACCTHHAQSADYALPPTVPIDLHMKDILHAACSATISPGCTATPGCALPATAHLVRCAAAAAATCPGRAAVAAAA